MGHRIDIKKGLFGRLTVGYDCPHCAARLKSPLDDAGKVDTCPECDTTFVVPGSEERSRIQVQRDADERRQREEEAERQRHHELLLNAAKESERKSAPDLLGERKVPKGDYQHTPQSSQTRRCPYCAEEILTAAKKCKHCGEFLTADLRQRQVPVQAQKQGSNGCTLIILIALGIVLAVFILALL